MGRGLVSSGPGLGFGSGFGSGFGLALALVISGGVQAGESSAGNLFPEHSSGDQCRGAAFHAAGTLASLRNSGTAFQNGGTNLLNLDLKAGTALYEFDVLDQDPRHPGGLPGHNIIRVTVETANCAPRAIQFVEGFL